MLCLRLSEPGLGGLIRFLDFDLQSEIVLTPNLFNQGSDKSVNKC